MERRSSDARLSKVMSHALRHAPAEYGLRLDEAGWVALADLLVGLQRRGKRWRGLTTEDLLRVVATCPKGRYERDGARIRARYGHSVEDHQERPSAVPPARLFHGTKPEALPSIREHGLLPMGRRHVHLAGDPEMAREVGQRHAGAPELLIVNASAAVRAGVTFHRGNDTVWLSSAIAAEFIAFPEAAARPLATLERGRHWARLLDEEVFAALPGAMHPGCAYEGPSATTLGPEAITSSYRDNAAWANATFDSITWESAVELIDDDRVLITLTDRLLHRGERHVYRCRQRVRFDGAGRVVAIAHEAIPAEERALAEFFRRVGVGR
ncbi:MAG: RNA 2'-phosphotransferase [Myxococcota bacterium]